MALLNELRTTWTGVAGSPYYTTVRHIVDSAVTFDDFKAAWGTFLNTMKTHYDNGLTAVNDAEVRVIETTTGETQGVFTTSQGTWAGSGLGDALPPSNQLLCRLNTPTFVGGRRIKGRIFIPGQIESDLGVNGDVLAGYVSFAQTALDTMLASMGNSLAVYSPTHHSYAVVTGTSVWNQWAIMRSRRP